MSKPQYLCHPNDAHIQRPAAGSNESARVELTDADGDEVFNFPQTWSDEQIMLALTFANRAFEKGCQVGAMLKTRAINKVLAEHGPGM